MQMTENAKWGEISNEDMALCKPIETKEKFNNASLPKNFGLIHV
jgi:hypothetical protein